eukprot:CAMPEP_0194339600 /NCGR_PEP_ID=MMETSP0171-20130528/83725_1 /TAXON_ID=218684 /ORGANISM="Corethron pennatum, Strain L29A3" /LENGTH=112 /DNA_ID=CAMNT_0039104219 /DNA_START=143 /DNA_END=478 /DNA_ORIENTATION=+
MVTAPVLPTLVPILLRRCVPPVRGVVDPVRIDEQNNTGGLLVGARAHTTNDDSKFHGGCRADFLTGDSVSTSTRFEPILLRTMRGGDAGPVRGEGGRVGGGDEGTGGGAGGR